MPSDPRTWMWAEACAMLERAERMQRRFFQPGRHGATWEPPADLYETEREYLLVLALPGVSAEAVTMTIDDGMLSVSAQRPIPVPSQATLIHRIEIPHGHFLRRFRLPAEPLELARREMVDGCLVISLRKLS